MNALSKNQNTNSMKFNTNPHQSNLSAVITQEHLPNTSSPFKSFQAQIKMKEHIDSS
jgi:hypothetical protein